MHFKLWILAREDWGAVGRYDYANADGDWSAKVRSARMVGDTKRVPDWKKEGEPTAEDRFGIKKMRKKCKKK